MIMVRIPVRVCRQAYTLTVGNGSHDQLLVPVAYASGACPAMIHVGLDLPVAVQWQDLVGLVR